MMERLMLFFTFSFFLFYNFINAKVEAFTYYPVAFVFIGIVTMFLVWVELPKLTYRLGFFKQLSSSLISYILNLMITTFLVHFSFVFYQRINFETSNLVVMIGSCVVFILYFIVTPFLVALIQYKVVKFVVCFLEDLIIQEISKESQKTFEKAKSEFAPQLSFRSIGATMKEFNSNQTYLYGAHHILCKFPERQTKISRKNKMYHYEKIVKQLMEIYNPFSDESQYNFITTSNILFDTYFDRVSQELCTPIIINGSLHVDVQKQLEVIREKQEEFFSYLKFRYGQLKKIQSDLFLDFVAEKELNQTLRNTAEFKNLGDCFPKNHFPEDQQLIYPFKLIVTTKGFYLAYLVNLGSVEKYQLMINEKGEVSRISIHDEFEETVHLTHLIEDLVFRSEQLYYQIGLHTDLLAIQQIGIQPILLLAENNQVIGELPDIEIRDIKSFRRELEKAPEKLTKDELKALEELLSEITETEIMENVFDFQYELTHNIQVFQKYMSQVKDLMQGFESLQNEIESKYRVR